VRSADRHKPGKIPAAGTAGPPFQPSSVHLVKWRPNDQNAVSRSAVLAPAREDDGAGREVAVDTIARPCAKGRSGQRDPVRSGAQMTKIK
jgi:hypothetical protein